MLVGYADFGVTNALLKHPRYALLNEYERGGTENIEENNYTLSFAYRPDFSRIQSDLTYQNALIEKRLYFGNYEIYTDAVSEKTEHIHYVPGPDGICAIITGTSETEFTAYYCYNDHLASIVTITDNMGNVVHEQNFSAWGRHRDPLTWAFTTNTTSANLPWFNRGFTGHEYLAAFTFYRISTIPFRYKIF